jgi:hypothetical protein
MMPNLAFLTRNLAPRPPSCQERQGRNQLNSVLAFLAPWRSWRVAFLVADSGRAEEHLGVTTGRYTNLKNAN